MNVPGPSRTLYDLPVIADSLWQMSYGERFALEGLVASLEPALAIETGTAQGGSLRRIAAHAGEVHCFDIVDEVADVVADIPNATAHIGDSAVTLPTVLAEFVAEGRHVDFALIDGDHTFEGVQRDTRAVLDSEACRRTVIVFHDTANDEVRAGLDAMDLPNHPKVQLCMLDFVPGYLVREGNPFAGQCWNGLGLVVLDDERAPGPAQTDDAHYPVPELYALARPQAMRSVGDVGGDLDGDPLGGLAPFPATRFEPPPAEVAEATSSELARAWLAAVIGEDREVLQVGCANARVLNLLAERGTRGVAAVAPNETVAEVVRAEADPRIEVTASAHDGLPFEGGRFGALVWLDADPAEVGPALPELHRVLADDGVLLVSVDNADGSTAALLRDALPARFDRVEVRRQQTWVTSLLLDDATFSSPGLERLDDAQLVKAGGAQPGSEPHTIVLASNAALPHLPVVGAVGDAADLRTWRQRFEEQNEALLAQHARVHFAATRLRELKTLRRELAQSEKELARLPDLSAEVFGTKRDIERLRHDLEHERAHAQAQLARAQGVIEQMKRSPSWRITAPLRALKRALRS